MYSYEIMNVLIFIFTSGFAASYCGGLRFARLLSAPLRFAPLRSGRLRFASLRFAPHCSAPVRFASLRFSSRFYFFLFLGAGMP